MKTVYAYLETGVSFVIEGDVEPTSEVLFDLARAHFKDMLMSQDPIEVQIEIEEE